MYAESLLQKVRARNLVLVVAATVAGNTIAVDGVGGGLRAHLSTNELCCSLAG